MNRKRLLGIAVPLAVWAGLAAIPAPAGLSPVDWHYFALFAAVIVGLITEPIPGSIIGLLGVSVAAVLQLVSTKPSESINWALSGFANNVIWLIFIAYIFGLGYEKSGLGKRI